jgi:hypothetical protein
VTTIHLFTTDTERIGASYGPAFDAELIDISGMTQRPAAYPTAIKWPPDWVGVAPSDAPKASVAIPSLDEFVAQLRVEPPTEHIAFGLSDPSLLTTSALDEVVEIAHEQGVDAYIVVDLGD